MSAFLFVLEGVLAAVVAALLIARFAPIFQPKPSTPDDELRSIIAVHVRRTVLVTMKDARAFRGVLYEADDEVIVLRDVKAPDAGPRGETVEVDGEVLLFRADVAFVQFP